MKVKNNLRMNENIKKELAAASLFPLTALMIICAPNDLLSSYTLLSISKSFLSPALFIIVDMLVCYIAGIAFVLCTRYLKKGGTVTDIYNCRLLLITTLFFLHIWILLFVFERSVFVSIECILLALIFSFFSVISFSKCGGVGFIATLLLTIWTLSLLIWNIGVIFA